MLSKTDIKNLIKVFATKEDLIELATKAELKQAMESVMEKLDSIYDEIKNIRKEQLIHVEIHREIRTEIDNVKHKIAAKS